MNTFHLLLFILRFPSLVVGVALLKRDLENEPVVFVAYQLRVGMFQPGILSHHHSYLTICHLVEVK